jgi:hypothetical protein
MKAPWDFSKPPAPGGPAVLNRPTREGRQIGRLMARFHRLEMLRHPGQKDCCHDCAFRRGTTPNGCASTVMDAMKCVMEKVPFLCHAGMVSGEGAPAGVCQGWLVMVRKDEAWGSRPPILLGPISAD